MDRHLSACVPLLHPQMAAVYVDKRLHENQPQPQKTGRELPLGEGRNPLCRIQIGLLKHVVCIDALDQPLVEPEVRHTPEPLPMQREKLT